MKTFSKITQRYYDPEDCVFIGNLKQAGLYIKHGAEVTDILWSEKTRAVVIAFTKASTQDLYILWNRRELE